MRKKKQLVSWVHNLAYAGTIRNKAEAADRIRKRIADARANIRTWEADLRRLDAEAEKSALELGWTPEQVAAAREGKMMFEDGGCVEGRVQG